MANYEDRVDKFYVVKVSKRDSSLEYMHVRNFSGHTHGSQNQDGMSFDEAPKANRFAASLNNIYEENGLEFYCYVVRNAENSIHLIKDIPADYKRIVQEHFGVVDPDLPDEETEETEEGTEDPQE